MIDSEFEDGCDQVITTPPVNAFIEVDTLVTYEGVALALIETTDEKSPHPQKFNALTLKL